MALIAATAETFQHGGADSSAAPPATHGAPVPDPCLIANDSNRSMERMDVKGSGRRTGSVSSVDANRTSTNSSTNTAGQMAGQVADSAKQQATEQARTHKNQAAKSVDSAVDALNSVSSHLRKDNQDQVANVADMAANQLGRVSNYLEHTSVNQIVNDVQDAARQQPALFLTGAFALGVIAARFLKSSAPSQPSWRNNQGNWQQGNWQQGNWQQGNWQQGNWQQGRYGTARPLSSQGYAQGYTNQTNQQSRSGRTDGAPFGVYDPGSEGVQVREVPQ